MMDFEGMSDLYVVAKFEDQRKQTDIHYRSTNGVVIIYFKYQNTFLG